MRPRFLITLLALLVTTSLVKSQNIETVTKEDNKFIYSNSIKLFLGDSIYIEANKTGKILSDFVKVNSISDSTKTISIKFTYDKFGSNNVSLLKVSNPFSKVLNYKAKIRIAPGKRYSVTSIMPVWGGIFGMEMWPYKIESIILYDFELTEQ